MNSKISEVMQRRGELLAKVASQREQLAEIGVGFQAPLALAEKGVVAVRFLRSHPVLAAAGVIAVLVMCRRSVAGVVWKVWKGYRNFSAITSRFSS